MPISVPAYTGKTWVDNSSPPLSAANVQAMDDVLEALGGQSIAKSSEVLNLSGGTMSGGLVLNGAPTADLQAATKKYSDTTDAPINAVTSSMTLAAANVGQMIVVNSASAVTITIPAGNTLPVGSAVEIYRRGSGTVSITGASGVYAELRDNSQAVVLSSNVVGLATFSSAVLKHVELNYWSIQGV